MTRMEHQRMRLIPLPLMEALAAPTVDVETAARLLGVGRSAAYEAIRTGTFPVRVIRVGVRRVRVPTVALLRELGVADDLLPPARGASVPPNPDSAQERATHERP